MTEQELDDADVGSIFEQMNSEGVSQGMGRDRFSNTAAPVRLLARLFDGMLGDVLAGNGAWKQPLRGLFGSPPSAQDIQQFWRQHDVSVLCAVNGYVVLGGGSATGTSRRG